MAVFGLGSVVSMINPGDIGNVRENPTVASWKGGGITRSDLDAMRIRHFQSLRFLQGLQFAASEKKGDNFRSLAMPIRPIAQGNDFKPELVDEQLLSRYLLAQRAENEGLIIGDGMLDDYFALTAGNVPMSRSELIAVNKRANQNQVGFETIKRHLKMELAAQQMQNFTMAGIPMIPNPLDAIELYSKTSSRVECQILPIPVDVADVTTEPAASEIRRVFDEGKSQYADPRGIEPGFKVPKKVKVQYFVADRDTFLQNEINKLTTEEVQAEYDRLVAEESGLVMEVVPDDEAPEIDIDITAPEFDEVPMQEDGSEANTNDSSETDEAPLVPDSVESADESPATDEKANEEGQGDDANGGLSSTIKRTKATYVSTHPVQEETETPAAEVVEEAAKTASDEAGKIVGDAAETVQEEATETPTNSVPPSGAASVESQQGSSAEKKPDVGSLDELMNQKDPSKVELPELTDEPKVKRRAKALVDCAQQIKESMKREDANAAIDKALASSEAELGMFRSLYTRWKFADEETRGEKPAALDFKSIADKYNLEFRETELVDDIELEETEIGKVRVFRQVRGPNGQPRPIFPFLANVIFDDYHDASEFDAKRENDMAAGASYVYWLAEKTDSRIPELDEVKDEVIEYLKKNQAYDAAMKRAEEIAAKVNGTNGEKTLIAEHPEKAVSSGGFTWFTVQRNTPSISNPIGVTNAGNEFMKTVFSLNQYDAAATSNYSRDTVYVVQMMTEKPPVTETGNDYLENRFFKFKTIPNDVRSVSQWYGQEIGIDWNKEFTESLDFELIGQ